MDTNSKIDTIQSGIGIYNNVQGRHILGQNRCRICFNRNKISIRDRDRKIIRYPVLGLVQILLDLCAAWIA